MGAVWLTGKVKVEILLVYLLCHGLLHAGRDLVTHMALVMSYIPIHTGGEEKYTISFIFSYLLTLPHPR